MLDFNWRRNFGDGLCLDKPQLRAGEASGALETTMTYEEFNAFCRALPQATYVVQWGGSHVWKVGGKVFAIGGWNDDRAAVTFKVSETSFEILKTRRGLRPAPYLASRGMSWIQHYAKPGLSDKALKDYIRASYVLVARGLPRKTQRSLGLASNIQDERRQGGRRRAANL